MTETVKPKIFVFCNGCGKEWHSACAIAEDGHVLAGHICSDHCFIPHDMGVIETGWKRDKYAAHYPDGFEVVLVEKEDVKDHAELQLAFERNAAIPRVTMNEAEA